METKHREIKELIGSHIKQLRRSRGMSQEELAEKIGIGSKYLSSIERGRENPTLDTLIRLSLGLNIDIFEMVNYSQKKSANELRKTIKELTRRDDVEKLDLALRILKAIYY